MSDLTPDQLRRLSDAVYRISGGALGDHDGAERDEVVLREAAGQLRLYAAHLARQGDAINLRVLAAFREIGRWGGPGLTESIRIALSSGAQR